MGKCKLKPCPFCGGAAIYRSNLYRGGTMHYIRCQKCQAGLPSRNTADAAAGAWNMRAPNGL